MCSFAPFISKEKFNTNVPIISTSWAEELEGNFIKLHFVAVSTLCLKIVFLESKIQIMVLFYLVRWK